MVREFEPHVGLHADSAGPAWDSLCSSPSLSKNKPEKKRKEKKGLWYAWITVQCRKGGCPSPLVSLWIWGRNRGVSKSRRGGRFGAGKMRTWEGRLPGSDPFTVSRYPASCKAAMTDTSVLSPFRTPPQTSASSSLQVFPRKVLDGSKRRLRSEGMCRRAELPGRHVWLYRQASHTTPCPYNSASEEPLLISGTSGN